MAEVLRVSIVGTMPSGEEFSVNPVWSIGGDFGVPVSAVQAQTIATAITAVVVPTGLLQAIPASCAYTGCRVEARSLAGVLEAQAEAIRTTPTVGTSTSAHGFSAAAVSSLRTAFPGASGRGRLYWPATAITMNNISLRIEPSSVTTTLSAVKTYLSGIETAVKATLSGSALGVWSRKIPDVNVVTQLQMGNVLDTQRRRRDALVESYNTLSFP